MTDISETQNRARSAGRGWQIGIGVVALAVSGLWLALTPGGLLGKADAVGYAVCHRIDLRSFHLGERALPLCARCTGMYLGALVSGFYYKLRRPRAAGYPPRAILMALGLCAAVWALDGLNSFATAVPGLPSLYQPLNPLRLLTGSLIGVGLMTLIMPAFNQLAWHEPHSEPILGTWGELGGLLALVAGIDLLILTENPLLLYPLALLSSLGVLVLLTLAYSLISLQVLRKVGQARRWVDLWPALLMSASLALLQIGVLDLLRFILTGTWSGFQL